MPRAPRAVAAPHALSRPPRFLALELWNLDRSSNASVSGPTQWQASGLLASTTSPPEGNVTGVRYNVTPRDVLTDVSGACAPAAAQGGSLPSLRKPFADLWTPPTQQHTPGLLYQKAYQRVVIDRRACGSGGASPDVGPLCSSELCPMYSAVSSTTPNYCTSLCGALCPAGNPAVPVGVTVWNTGQSGNAATPLSYQLAAACSPTPPCPAPTPNLGPCAGHGACSAERGTCSCTFLAGNQSTWADVGCDKALRVLQPNASLPSEAVPAGGWAYYAVQGTPGQALQVYLRRSAGDPVLFLKAVQGLPLPGALPSLQDWQLNADQASFSAAEESASRVVLQASSGLYYAAVYANGDDSGDDNAAYSLAVTSSACPLDCAGRGACVSGVCVCQPAWSGPSCLGAHTSFGQSSGQATATLTAGQWAYFSLTMPQERASNSWSLGGSGGQPHIVVRLRHNGSDPVFVAKLNTPPQLSSGGFQWPQQLFTSEADVTKLQVRDADKTWDLAVSAGDQVYFGLLNYGGRQHSANPVTLTFSVKIEQGGEESLGISPSFMSIILGIVLSMFLCLMLSVCRRYGARWLVHRRAGTLWGELPPGMVLGPNGVVMAVRPRPMPPRGLPRATIDAFPTAPFEEGSMSKEDATCSVCLADYEVGEVLRTLPSCRHAFHMPCIDEWLASHQTCPLCRESLADAGAGAPRGADVEMQEVRADGYAPTRLLVQAPADADASEATAQLASAPSEVAAAEPSPGWQLGAREEADEEPLPRPGRREEGARDAD